MSLWTFFQVRGLPAEEALPAVLAEENRVMMGDGRRNRPIGSQDGLTSTQEQRTFASCRILPKEAGGVNFYTCSVLTLVGKVSPNLHSLPKPPRNQNSLFRIKRDLLTSAWLLE